MIKKILIALTLLYFAGSCAIKKAREIVMGEVAREMGGALSFDLGPSKKKEECVESDEVSCKYIPFYGKVSVSKKPYCPPEEWDVVIEDESLERIKEGFSALSGFIRFSSTCLHDVESVEGEYSRKTDMGGVYVSNLPGKTSAREIKVVINQRNAPENKKEFIFKVFRNTPFKVRPYGMSKLELSRGFYKRSGVLEFEGEYPFQIISTSRGQIVDNKVEIDDLRGKNVGDEIVIEFENLENEGEIIKETYPIFTQEKFQAFVSSDSLNGIRRGGSFSVSFDSNFDYNILSTSKGDIEGNKVKVKGLAVRGRRADVKVVLENRDNPGETVELKF